MRVKRFVLGVGCLLATACSGMAAPVVPDAVRKPVEAYYTEQHQDMVDPEEQIGRASCRERV